MNKNAIVKKGMWVLGLLLMLGVSAAAYGVSRTGERSDCPGKVECPLTGEKVCKDQCPLTDAQRADCPGKVECRLTGELVCQDKCPVEAGTETAQAEEEVPACCSKK